MRKIPLTNMTPKELLELAKKANQDDWNIGHISESEPDAADIDAYQSGQPICENAVGINRSWIVHANPKTMIPLLEAAEKMYQLLRLELIEWPMQKDAIEAWEKLK